MCIHTCHSAATAHAETLAQAINTCFTTTCDPADGGDDARTCCVLASKCEKAGDSDSPGPGFTCTGSVCSTRGVCADTWDACMNDK
jgi:hypothetical protein